MKKRQTHSIANFAFIAYLYRDLNGPFLVPQFEIRIYVKLIVQFLNTNDQLTHRLLIYIYIYQCGEETKSD